jgi:hypothetical protein
MIQLGAPGPKSDPTPSPDCGGAQAPLTGALRAHLAGLAAGAAAILSLAALAAGLGKLF